MGSNEGDGAIVLLACGGVLLVTARIFGLRRVLWGLLIMVSLGVLAALRTLGVIVGSRRY
jgi:hypothetical protein